MIYTKKALFFSDLDGTLLKSDHTFSLSTQTKVRELFEQGYILIPITARTTKDTFQQARALGIDQLGGIVVASNGSQIYDFKTNQYLVNNYLPHEIVAKVFQDTYNKYEAKVNFYGDDAIYVFNEGKNSSKWARMAALRYVITHDVREITQPITHLTIILRKDTSPEQAEEYLAQLKQDYEGKVAILVYSSRVYELSPLKTSKGEAVKIINHYLGVDTNFTKTYGFGDGANDISLFDSVEVGVAMINASSEVMAVADDITTESNNEDGVVKYIERNVLNQEEEKWHELFKLNPKSN